MMNKKELNIRTKSAAAAKKKATSGGVKEVKQESKLSEAKKVRRK